MFCIKCGKKVDEGIKYCDNCNVSDNSVKIKEESKQSINNNTPIDIDHKKEKKKRKKLKVVGWILGILLVVGLFNGEDESNIESSSNNTITTTNSENTSVEVENIDNNKEEQIEKSEGEGQLSNEEILMLLANAYGKIAGFLEGADWDNPSDNMNYPLLDEFNTFEKLDAYLDEYWSEGSTEIILSNCEEMLVSENGIYHTMPGGRIVPLDYRKGKVLGITKEGDKHKVVIEALDQYGVS